MATTEARHEKAARNQSLFRDINERIVELTENGGVPKQELWELICECADAACVEPISLTYPEYETIRRIPTHFPIKPGHELVDVERVVERRERYHVVEKIGESGRIAVSRDPRRD